MCYNGKNTYLGEREYMLTGDEKQLLEQSYFNVLEENDYFYKVQSNNVNTEWIILATEVSNDPKPIVVYRKKYQKGTMFQLESVESGVEQAITQIKRYDEVVSQQKINKMMKKRDKISS